MILKEHKIHTLSNCTIYLSKEKNEKLKKINENIIEI